MIGMVDRRSIRIGICGPSIVKKQMKYESSGDDEDDDGDGFLRAI
jgi:hypothetical protein